MKKLILPSFLVLFGFSFSSGNYEYFLDGRKRVNTYTGEVQWHRDKEVIKTEIDWESNSFNYIKDKMVKLCVKFKRMRFDWGNNVPESQFFVSSETKEDCTSLSSKYPSLWWHDKYYWNAKEGTCLLKYSDMNPTEEGKNCYEYYQDTKHLKNFYSTPRNVNCSDLYINDKKPSYCYEGYEKVIGLIGINKRKQVLENVRHGAWSQVILDYSDEKENLEKKEIIIKEINHIHSLLLKEVEKNTKTIVYPQGWTTEKIYLGW